MSKSKLHLLCQQRGWDLPTYEVNKQGHDHNPLFYATVTVNASSFSTSSPSSSSKKAKSDAAELALNHFSLPAPSLSAGCSSGSAGGEYSSLYRRDFAVEPTRCKANSPLK
ncbi:hypothetical protein OIU77_006990 [Salix suchowensis]|uniref:DRBM domain-containing protein n=1 Tax=Salix suchowensis TaxID=1278906 RepID=A0ABQ9AP68_9ROSI|nr:hypothetical protein OIU77_006990 [Salix suchowensis]